MDLLVTLHEVDLAELDIHDRLQDDIFLSDGIVSSHYSGSTENKEIDKRSKKIKKPSMHHKTYENKMAAIVLQGWVATNFDNPYPSKEEIKKLLDATELSKKQIDSWFCNYRARNSQNSDRGYKWFWKELEKEVAKPGFQLETNKQQVFSEEEENITVYSE